MFMSSAMIFLFVATENSSVCPSDFWNAYKGGYAAVEL